VSDAHSIDGSSGTYVSPIASVLRLPRILAIAGQGDVTRILGQSVMQLMHQYAHLSSGTILQNAVRSYEKPYYTANTAKDSLR
jgi:hypothetical protein